METINQAVLSKVRAEAKTIVEEAEAKMREEIEKAKRQREAKLEEEKARMLAEAREEAARILAQASIKARRQLSSAKSEAIARITDLARRELSRASHDESCLLTLTKEAVDGLGVSKARIYVSPNYVGTVKELLEADKELSARIVEVRESDCLGGVIAEDIEGKLRIDNTYETRLDSLLPKLLPDISKQLFGAL